MLHNSLVNQPLRATTENVRCLELPPARPARTNYSRIWSDRFVGIAYVGPGTALEGERSQQGNLDVELLFGGVVLLSPEAWLLAQGVSDVVAAGGACLREKGRGSFRTCCSGMWWHA